MSLSLGGFWPKSCIFAVMAVTVVMTIIYEMNMVQHVACRTSEELLLYIGAKIGYWRGDIKGLVDDIGKLMEPPPPSRPTNPLHPYASPLPHPSQPLQPTPAFPYTKSAYC